MTSGKAILGRNDITIAQALFLCFIILKYSPIVLTIEANYVILTKTLLAKERKLAKFYKCSNNGTTAVVKAVDYEVYRDYLLPRTPNNEDYYDVGTFNLMRPPVPVFTFSDAVHMRGLVTGTHGVMDLLLEGHQVEEKGMFVPFSNGGGYPDSVFGDFVDHGYFSSELPFVATIGEAIEAFELVRAPQQATVS